MATSLFSLGNDPEKQKLLEQQAAAKESLLTAPISPMEQVLEKNGKGKTAGKMLLTALSGGLLAPVLMPELIGAGARYENDLALYQKQREMALVDPQDQALADAIRNGTVGPELMALQVLAGGVDKLNMDQATLSPGQIRYDAFGNVVAKGGDPVVSPTSVMQNAQETAKGYGIPVGSQAYADLIAAYAEPSGSQTLADGTVVPFNTVDKVLADWDSGAYNQNQQAAGGQAGGASGTTPGGGVTPQGATDATVRKVMNEEIAENLKISDQKIGFYDDLERVISNFGEWDPDANDGEGGFTVNEATLDNYGSVQNHPLYPGRYDFFKGDDEKDALVYMDQLVEMLTVDERGKLKGQGQITEGETEMLRRATTALRNRDLSDKAVQKEIEVLMRGLINRRLKFQDLQKQYGKDGKGGNTADDFDTMWDNS